MLYFILAVLLFNRIRGQISEEQIGVESEIVIATAKLDDSYRSAINGSIILFYAIYLVYYNIALPESLKYSYFLESSHFR